ncbi:DUF4870 domain-containing protein [Tenacibaculum sp. UWU-22]|uniref:DUF4870 domain-containing protein n=1 Tax=Tenacibaculum sp. UWU-22 TaxID=3234187 RepID=UPI0034DB0B0E
MKNSNENAKALLIHISAFTGYLFPFGSIITPLILWQSLKERSFFLDQQGKEAVNFNISFALYLFIISTTFFIPLFFGSFFNLFKNLNRIDFGVNIIPDFSLFLGSISLISVAYFIKIVLIILAALKANEGEIYHYPLTIKFIK